MSEWVCFEGNAVTWQRLRSPGLFGDLVSFGFYKRRILSDESAASLILEAEFILHPRVHVRALETGVQISFAFDLPGVELAALGVIAGNQVGVDFLFAFPWFEIGNLRQRSRCAHPFDRLIVVHNEDVLGTKRYLVINGETKLKTLPYFAKAHPRNE